MIATNGSRKEHVPEEMNVGLNMTQSRKAVDIEVATIRIIRKAKAKGKGNVRAGYPGQPAVRRGKSPFWETRQFPCIVYKDKCDRGD